MFAHSLVERAGDFHMHETGFAQAFGATRMNRHGRPVQEPFARARHGTDGVQQCRHRIRTRDVDDGRRTVNGLLQILDLLRGKLNGNAHVGGQLFHIGAKLCELFGQPLATGLTARNQHAARNLSVLQKIKERFAA